MSKILWQGPTPPLPGFNGRTFAAVFCLWLLAGQTAWAQGADAEVAADTSPTTGTIHTPGQVLATAKASFHIHYATWGATDAVTKRDHAVDVTERVEALLADQGSFLINAKVLQVDPWPGQSKFLYISYAVAGKDASLVIRAKKEITLERLLVHAGAIPKRSTDAGEVADGPTKSNHRQAVPFTEKIRSMSRAK